MFAYQKAIRDVGLKDLPSPITEDTIPILKSLISPEFVDTENSEEALKKFADLLIASEFVKRADITKDGENYILGIDRCIFAEHIHNKLKPTDVTCPWAIMMMAIAEKTSHRKVMINPSHYTKHGTKTLILFLY